MGAGRMVVAHMGVGRKAAGRKVAVAAAHRAAAAVHMAVGVVEVAAHMADWDRNS